MRWSLKIIFGMIFWGPSRLQASIICETILASPNKISFATLDEFFAAPKMDGTAPFPVGKTLYFNLDRGDEKTSYQLGFRSELISNLPKDIRHLIKDLKVRHKPMDPGEREWAGIIAKYSDGSSAGIKLTSNIINRVTGEDLTAAINGSRIFKSGKVIDKVIHIHTHPDPRNPNAPSISFIPPNEVDFSAYSYLRRLLRKHSPDIKFEALVVPSCEFCEGIVFVVDDQMIDKFSLSIGTRKRVLKKSKFLKMKAIRSRNEILMLRGKRSRPGCRP